LLGDLKPRKGALETRWNSCAEARAVLNGVPGSEILFNYTNHLYVKRKVGVEQKELAYAGIFISLNLCPGLNLRTSMLDMSTLWSIHTVKVNTKNKL